jgi:hypothetical protein
MRRCRSTQQYYHLFPPLVSAPIASMAVPVTVSVAIAVSVPVSVTVAIPSAYRLLFPPWLAVAVEFECQMVPLLAELRPPPLADGPDGPTLADAGFHWIERLDDAADCPYAL